MIRFRCRPARSPALAAAVTLLEVVVSLLLFCGGVMLVGPAVGSPARLLVLIVVAYWGFRRGPVAAAAAALIGLLCPFLAPRTWVPPVVSLFILVVQALLGVVIGRMSVLGRRLEAELAARRLAEDRLREEQATFRIFFEGNPHPMWIFDVETLRYHAVNRAMCLLYGYSREDFAGMTVADIQMPENIPTLRTFLDGLDGELDYIRIVERRHRTKDGSTIELEIASQLVTFQGRRARLSLATDVTEQRRNRAALEFQANHDGLTGLPNRASFQRTLERSIGEAGPAEVRFALFLIDLDRFKEINDTLGHSYGDLVLQRISPRLRGALRPGDVLARLGGDEFGVLLPGADLAEAARVGRRLLEAFDEPFSFEGRDFDVGASVGIAAFPDHGGDVGTLLRLADVAMYVAKRGRGGLVAYAPGLEGGSRRKVDLIPELRRAIDRGELVLHYQPQVELATGRVCGAEALVRWDRPGEGLLPPSRFVPLAEQTDLIGPLGFWALREALTRCRAWRDGGIDLDVAVNLSPVSLRDARLVEKLAGLLDETGCPASRLTIEITEDAVMVDREAAREILGRLRALGVRISIDDFGTGRSSLAYLRDLPIDEMKLDRSFLPGLAEDRASRAIAGSVIRLGAELGVRVVAEGIEDDQTLALLRAMGAEYGQGFHLGRPMPERDFAAWIARRAARREVQLSI